MRRLRRSVAALLGAALLTASCGGDPADTDTASDDTTPTDQTIEIGMVDIAFEPEMLSVKAGSSVRFVFRNEGALPHQAFFGNEATQNELARGKGKRVGVDLKPGQARSFVQTFDQPGRLLIGCHIPGHYQAGMKIRLTIE
jgi:uncharacterized cupredoxin-like copper-binding protein